MSELEQDIARVAAVAAALGQPSYVWLLCIRGDGVDHTHPFHTVTGALAFAREDLETLYRAPLTGDEIDTAMNDLTSKRGTIVQNTVYEIECLEIRP